MACTPDASPIQLTSSSREMSTSKRPASMKPNNRGSQTSWSSPNLA
jgi:hypothetical protein